MSHLNNSNIKECKKTELTSSAKKQFSKATDIKEQVNHISKTTNNKKLLIEVII